MIKEHDVIALTEPVPAEGLEAGDTDTFVAMPKGGEPFEFEFMTSLGETITLVTLFASRVRQLLRSDMAHVRQLVS